MPLFHIHGLIGAVLSSVHAGSSIVCAPGFEPARFLSQLAAWRPTWYTAVPTMHQAILARAPRNQEILDRVPLRFVRSSSSSLPPQVMAELEEVVPKQLTAGLENPAPASDDPVWRWLR